MDNEQLREKHKEQQLCDNPLDFEGCLRQGIEIRRHFGILTPLPKEISFAREKCFFWIFHICEEVGMSIRGIELLTFIVDVYWMQNQDLITKQNMQKHVVCSFYLILTEVEKADLPIDSISWICQQKYSNEELLNHITTLQQYFPSINSYVTSLSLMMKITPNPLEEEEYKIVALFFFQTYSELTNLNALEILYVNVQFISICNLISSNTDQIQDILNKISGYLTSTQKDQLDAIAEELNQAAYELDQEEDNEQRILTNKRKYIEQEKYQFDEFPGVSASITNEDAFGDDEDSMVNNMKQGQQVYQKINNACCPSGIEKTSVCYVEQPMVSGEQLQDSSELITALYMNNNNNNINNLNTNNSFFESGVFSSSQQLNDLDLKTDHSNTTTNSNYNSNNINGWQQLNKGSEIIQEGYQLQQQQQQQQYQQRIIPLIEGNNKQTSIQSLSMQQLPTAFTLDGEHMQEE